MKGLQLWPIEGLGEVRPGDDLGAMLAEGIRRLGVTLEDRDIVVVTQKVVSKSEGRIVDLAQVQPSPFARALADRFGKDARLVELVLGETARVVRMDRSVWIMETRHGFVCANAGVDLSNVEGERAALLPLDPDASASRLRARLGELCGAEPAVIISDTFGRPWRMGQTNVAIGVAGMRPLLDYRGTRDDFGAELKVTHIAVADELAAAAELIMGKTKRCPAVLVRGYAYEPGDGSARELVRPPSGSVTCCGSTWLPQARWMKSMSRMGSERVDTAHITCSRSVGSMSSSTTIT